MLIQLPSGSPDQPGPQNAEQPNTAFEAGLRRDLASAPIVSYDAMLGGVGKRAIDVAVTLFTAPLWAPVLLAAAGIAKLRLREAVFLSDERIGYGGRTFQCHSLKLVASDGDKALEPAPENLVSITRTTPARGARWRMALERLPQLFNVLKGDMSLVGPSPLSREALEPLRSARRYYLSARPGVVGVSTIIGGSDDPSQYKIYAMSWAVTTDALILWDALRSLRDPGDLWKPSFARAKPGQSTSGVVVRRRSSGG